MDHTVADIIIVGAGAAGCIIATRLAAADPGLKILLLEEGPHTLGDLAVTTPAPFLNNLVPGAPRSRAIVAKSSAHLLGRAAVVQTGACVGGGTAINAMLYTRGSASDYDDWEVEHENPGWGFESMLPMFEKFETWSAFDASRCHGSAGPVHVTLGDMPECSKQWLEVSQAYDKRPLVSDFNDFHTSNAYSRWPRYIDEKGKRQDVAHRFLYPALQVPNSNITLRPQCTVNRVLFDGPRAVGVEFHDNSAADGSRVISVAHASKLVVLSAGALGSPLILERSGVGAPSILEAAGVTVKVDLPGVGENYQDHNLLGAAYVSVPGATGNRDAYLRGDAAYLAAATSLYEAEGRGLLATNAIDVGVKARPTHDELHALGDAFLQEWPYFARSPDKPVMVAGLWAGLLLPGGLPSGEYFTAVGFTAYPFSRGFVHIRSHSVLDPPVFVPGFLSHPADVAALMWQYKFGRERARRIPSYRGELAATHPPFSPTSEAACGAPKDGPAAVDAADIRYTEEDDKVLETWVRQSAGTTWHSMGTCAMKPRAKGGVVDPKLNVYGVDALKIADLSICPSNVSANTAATAMAIGEKVATIIAQELGLVL